MPNTILLKRTSTAGVTPAAASLTLGELAVNTADGKVYTKKSNNSLVYFANWETDAQGQYMAFGNANPIKLRTLNDAYSTISFEGSAGQLFSINNNLTSGSIFSVNDVSGIPSLDINADGTVSIASFGGNVGIGKTNPTTKLDVNGTVTATAFVGPLTGTASNADMLDSLDSTKFVRTDVDTNIDQTKGIRFGHANQSDSNDGFIAAAKFASGLNIVGAQTTAGTGRQVRIWGSVLDNNGNVFWHAGNDGPNSGLNADLLDGLHSATANTVSTIVARDASGNFAAGVGTFSGLTVDTNTLHVDSTNDRVGIGTTSPSSKLHIYVAGDDANVAANLGLQLAAPWMLIGDRGTNRTFTNGIGIKLHDGGVQHYSIGQINGNFLIAQTGSNGEKLFPDGTASVGILMNSSGNVAIGKTNPTTKLDVSGTVTATGFSGPLSGNASTATTAGNVTGVVAISNGGTGKENKAEAFNALSPTTALGDLIYGGASGAGTRLAGNTTAVKQFLSQTGTGTNSAAPAWSAVTKSDVGLGSVENTALSTWTGSANIATLGTITAGKWNADTITVAKGGTNLTSIAAKSILVANAANTYVGLAVNNGQSIRVSSSGTWEAYTPGASSGTVTSVEMTVPTGFSISGSPITSSGTLGLTFASGYSLPTNAKQTEWDTAYSDRFKWDGSNAGLNAATGRSSLGLGNVDNTADSSKSVASAGKWTNARTITVGATGKSVDGSGNISWNTDEIGAVNLTPERTLAIAAANWVTIATCSTGRAFGEFYVYDTDSGKHNFVKILASASYGSNKVAAICGNRYSTTTIAHVRVLYNTADRIYGGAKLQVYCASSNWTLRVRKALTNQITGWISWNDVTPVSEGTPSGWAEDTTARLDNITSKDNWSFTGNLLGNAASATKLTSGKTIAMTGDVVWTSSAFDGSANISNEAELATTGVTAASYTAPTITVDAKGRITAASSNTIPTVNNGTLSLGVSGTGLTGSASFTANQSSSSTFTVTSNATDANTADTIVARDALGNFNAGTITASLSGTASNATQFNNVNQETYTPSLRSNNILTGGGTITFDSSGNLKWSTRFIVINNGRGSNFSTNGYFDITCPTSGAIPGVGGAASRNATANGINIGNWEALYYILPIGSNSTSLAANFRIAGYGSNLDIPHNWVLIASRNQDNQTLYISNGAKLVAGTSINTSINDSRRAAAADILNTARNINGTSFDGSANITVAEPTFSGSLSSYSSSTADISGSGGLTARYLAPAATNKPTGIDHSLLTLAYNSSWATQLAGDWRTNTWYSRTQNSGTWGSWATMLSSANIGDYAPSKTGTGASGSWAISITGNAATATTAGSVTNTVPVDKGGTGLDSIAAKSILVANVANTYTTLTPSANQSIRISSGGTAWESYTPTSGTVTSVGLALPGIFNVTTSTVSSTGTLTAGLSNQNANTVFAGPASGSADQPTFRTLGISDIPFTTIFNNSGQFHSTRTAFDVSTPSYDFGWRYIQGSTNGPGTGGTQFYSLYVGLGSQYPATGVGSYGMYLAIDRDVTGPYLSVRYNENNVLGTWRKIRAGYADSAGAVAWSNVSSTPTNLSGYGITDAYTKSEVDSLLQGLDPKASVKAATTSNMSNLSGSGWTIDGVALAAGDRVLVKSQDNPAQNGIYVVVAGPWTRAADMDAWTKVPGAYVFVEQGTSQKDIGYVCTSDAGGTLDTTPITWVQFTGTTGALSNATNSTQSGYFGDIYLYDDSTPSHYLQITNSANLTAARKLSIDVGNADRTITLTGNTSLSGINTGDQTIELTGDVTGSGTGTFSTTLANTTVTPASYTLANVTVDSKGRITAASSNTAASTNTAGAIVVRDSLGNFSAGTITAALDGNASTVTDGVYTVGNQTITGLKNIQGNSPSAQFGAEQGLMRFAYPADWSSDYASDHVAIRIQTNGVNENHSTFGVVGIQFATSTSAGWGPFIGGTRTGAGNGDFVIKTGGGSVVERFRILDNGNVGIGTSAPTTKLHVSGTVTATSFVGSLTGNASTATTAGSVTNTVPVGKGGTNLTSIAAKSILVANTQDTFTALTPSANQSIRIKPDGSGWEVYNTTGFTNQEANLVLAGPATGAAAAPAFRALQQADIPNLNTSKITEGILDTERLGTGVANEDTYLRGDGTWQKIVSWQLDGQDADYTYNTGNVIILDEGEATNVYT